MSSIDSLRNRIDRALVAIEQQRAAMQTVARVVLCNQGGEPLPGYEPTEQRASYTKFIYLEDSPEQAA